MKTEEIMFDGQCMDCNSRSDVPRVGIRVTVGTKATISMNVCLPCAEASVLNIAKAVGRCEMRIKMGRIYKEGLWVLDRKTPDK